MKMIRMFANDNTVGIGLLLSLAMVFFIDIWSIEGMKDDFLAIERDYPCMVEEEKGGLYSGISSDGYRNWGVRDVCVRRSNGSPRSDTLSSEAYSMDNRALETGVGMIEAVTYDTTEQIASEISDGECEMLAQLVEAEAGNQDFKGKCLVADVVLNRVASKQFPDTVEDVIFQYLTDKYGNEHYQFSTVVDGSYDFAGWYISEDAFNAAYQEYHAERRMDDSVLYFTAGSYNPYCTPAYKYGDHYFGQ